MKTFNLIITALLLSETVSNSPLMINPENLWKKETDIYFDLNVHNRCKTNLNPLYQELDAKTFNNASTKLYINEKCTLLADANSPDDIELNTFNVSDSGKTPVMDKHLCRDTDFDGCRRGNSKDYPIT